MLCATNRVPISYELTAANTVEIRLTKELLEEAKLGEEVARRLSWEISPTKARISRSSWRGWGLRC
jgi:hypothetical protein